MKVEMVRRKGLVVSSDTNRFSSYELSLLQKIVDKETTSDYIRLVAIDKNYFKFEINRGNSIAEALRIESNENSLPSFISEVIMLEGIEKGEEVLREEISEEFHYIIDSYLPIFTEKYEKVKAAQADLGIEINKMLNEIEAFLNN
ncbi:hypothetical protein AB0W38_00380 [Aliarcobacter butzleri]|uniref:hypothetical protein n=1 Tax=Aliarcobacter butzleri TaxID=28197 RepID=UPI0034503405